MIKHIAPLLLAVAALLPPAATATADDQLIPATSYFGFSYGGGNRYGSRYGGYYGNRYGQRFPRYNRGFPHGHHGYQPGLRRYGDHGYHRGRSYHHRPRTYLGNPRHRGHRGYGRDRFRQKYRGNWLRPRYRY